MQEKLLKRQKIYVKSGTSVIILPRFSILPSVLDGIRLAAEQQRHAPDRGQAHQRVDHAADRGGLPAEQVGDHVESKQSDTAPVQPADDSQRQGDSVHNHHGFSIPSFDGFEK